MDPTRLPRTPYGPRFGDGVRQETSIQRRTFKDAKPSDIPVEQPTQMELVINLKTAKALGLTIPPSPLRRADEVIQ